MTRQDPHRHYLSPWAKQDRAPAGPSFDRGEGAHLVGEDGARVFDFSSGWIAATLGHSNGDMADAVAEQMRRLCFAPPSFPHALRSELARRLSDLSPWSEGARVHFTTGGGVSGALRTGKKRSQLSTFIHTCTGLHKFAQVRRGQLLFEWCHRIIGI